MIEIKARDYTRSVVVPQTIEGKTRAVEVQVSDPFKSTLGLVVQAQPIKKDGTLGSVYHLTAAQLELEIKQGLGLGYSLFQESAVPTVEPIA